MSPIGRRAWLGGAVAWAIAGCQSIPTQQVLLPLRYSGRLALQVAGDAERSFTAGFELLGSPSVGALALITPLGTLHGRAEWSPRAVQLVTGEGTRRYASLEDLAHDLLGEALPLAMLFDWLAGRPSDMAGNRLSSTNQVSDFDQLGWHVDLQRHADGLIVATRSEPAPRLTVRVKLDPR